MDQFYPAAFIARREATLERMPSLLESNLHLLCCPVCYAALKLTAATVDCTGCGRSYPIVDGLPVLIGTRATLPQEKG